MRMQIWIDNRTEVSVDEKLYTIMEQVVEKALEQEKHTTSVEVSISLVQYDEIQRLNKQFRHKDKPTDVLSFPMLDESVESSQIEEQVLVLGDIIICMDQARVQAEEYGHSLEREIAFLTAHSMFHLMGYDHMNKEEEQWMEQKQEAVLQALGIVR